MNYRIPALGAAALGIVALHVESARAQPSANSQDLQIYAGYIFGDRLTESPLSGERSRLDDNGTFGARYTCHFSEQFGVQLAAGYSPNRASHVPSDGSDLGLTTADLDIEWHILPDFQFLGHPLVPYAVVGVGYAWAHLDQPILGSAGNTRVSITNSDGVTGNAGVGAKYYLTDRVFVDFDARFRYMSKLVSNYGQGLNTAETSLSVGYRF
jgi:outer membrane protein W